MQITDFLNLLEGVKQSSKTQWTAHCPCASNHKHGDKNRSLSIGLHDTKILVNCQTGCTVDEICNSLGIGTGDLFTDAPQGKREKTQEEKRQDFIKWFAEKNNLQFVAAHSYCYDEFADGLMKIKFKEADGNKTFRWIHDDDTAKSGFKMSHAGCPNRLYVAGDPYAMEVFVVEGEKDADNLHSITGKTAASAENGAQTVADAQSKWKQVYTDQLAGKNVIVLHDNDTAGRVFAKLEADSIATKAASVRVVDIATVWKECPEKGDVSDMIQALGKQETLNRLQTLISNAPIWKITLDFPEIAPGVLDGIEGYDEVDVSDGDRTPEQPPQPKEKMGVQTFQDFLDKIQTEAYKPLSTGLQSFDEMLGGGIPRQSIVILTAAPGAGKTALTQQVFETMAAGGANVLFINLEMSREQLMARSLSRIIRRQGGRMSATAIMRGYKWTDEQRQYMQYAAEEYRERLADHIVYNPVESTDIEKILATINDIAKKCKDAGKEVPVVVLDYLHLVTTEKQQEQAEIIKRTVAGLKQYAINYDTFCFVISANNREANKNGVITLNSGRDTSAIEYSADIQISLNYREFAEPKKFHKRDGHRYDPQDPNDVEELQRMNPRHMVIQTLKNRMCGISKKLYMEFDAECSTFTAVEPEIPNAGFTVSFGKNSHRNPKSFLDEIECMPSEDGGLCEIRRKDEEEDYL